jgi:hypothetical protein
MPDVEDDGVDVELGDFVAECAGVAWSMLGLGIERGRGGGKGGVVLTNDGMLADAVWPECWVALP